MPRLHLLNTTFFKFLKISGVHPRHCVGVIVFGQVLFAFGRVMNERAFTFLACLVAMTFMAQRLKHIVKECVLPYVSPRKYVVNVYG
jgi:hypothetical protein